MRRGVRLRYLDRIGNFRSGNARYYYRRNGKRVAMPDLPPDHPDSIAAYAAAHGQKPPENTRTGTIAAGIDAYLASDTFVALAAATRDQRRRIAGKIRERIGRGTMDTLEARHIRKDMANFTPSVALNRHKTWRALCGFWLDKGLIDRDPSRDVRKPKLPKSDGHKAWTREDFEAFRAHWPIGIPQRLAFELAYQTCASAVDLVRLGPGNMRDGMLYHTRQKSGSQSASPVSGAPAWFEASPHLSACLMAAPKHAVYLTTAGGAARSHKAVSSWFSAACTKAGLTDLSLHGIRKGRAAMFRENGTTADQRMAILGHETESEAQHYSKSADLKRIITGT